MKDEKDLKGQDSDALELQIDKMIDELFVGKEESASADQQGVSGEAGTSGDETVFGPAEGGMDPGTPEAKSAEVSALGMQEPRPGLFEGPGSVGASEGTGGALSEKAEMETQWDMGVPGAEVADRSVRQETGISTLGVAEEATRFAQPETVQPEVSSGELQFAAVTSSAGEPAPVAKGQDDDSQRLYNSLKENILSLEWEISPQNIERFVEAMRPVQEHLASNPSAIKAGSMMVSVLSYIRRIGRSALPLSIQVLQNGVDFLGTVLIPEEHADGEKRKELLATFVDHYRVLKFQIEQQRDKVPRPKAPTVATPSAISPDIAEYIKGVVDETVRSMVEATVQEELRKLKQEIMESLARGESSGPAPAAVEPARETVVEDVLTVTLGDRYFNISKALVANVYSPSPRKLAKVLESKAFRISDLISLFGSVSKGLLGPLALVPASEVKNLTFELLDAEKAFDVPGYLQPRQLVLISDGKKGFGLLADATIWRTIEVPKGLTERILTGAEGAGTVLQGSPEEYPFLNVAKML
jgi:hypothetical protein